jgi:hypothetical protein
MVAREPKAWGHAWHVPSNPARTQQQVVDDIAGAAGVPTVHVRALPHWALRALGLFAPIMRELAETEYQFRDDFVMDSSTARSTFGFEPTPWDDVLAATVRSYAAATKQSAEQELRPGPHPYGHGNTTAFDPLVEGQDPGRRIESVPAAITHELPA